MTATAARRRAEHRADRPATTDPDAIAALVERYGLQRAGARQPFADYTRQLWARRRFIAAYAAASNAVGYERSFLGQAWQLLTPLFNVGVYYLVFGVLLNSKHGVHNFIAFLAVGIFVFAFCTGSINMGSRSITANLGLTRALHFPRAVLPAATTLMALLQLLYSLVVLVPIVLITGERPSWWWFSLAPAFALQWLFCMGCAFVFARIGTKVPDTSQTLPFVMRVWMYLSGVMYSVDNFARHHAEWVHVVLTVNPGYVYVSLARHALVAGNPVTGWDWALAVGWAVAAFVFGYVCFWRGEEEYGNA